MDNEAPNYARWIPEAGGYVANGKVVSKSPVYEEDGSGKMKLDVDASLFAPQTQSQPQQSQNVQVANNPLTNNGITTANTTGSGTDVNSLVTNIGSMASTNNNTATTGGVLTSPAMTSPNTNLKPSQISGKTMDDLLADFAWFQGENNLQGMINTLTQMSTLDGQDRTAQIDELRKAREQKIMSTDDQYLENYNQARTAYSQAQRAYSQAVAIGDAEAAKQAEAQAEQAKAVMDQIQAQQESWRESVGYQDAMTSAYNREVQNNRIEYETTYMDNINNKIVPVLTQLVEGFINFQYDPYQDTGLMMAQSMVEARMRNSMAATGMYYSSTTQYAVAQAIGELIPVYEKMAKEEKLQQIQLLQSTASFLLNLEEAQFDMWRSQIELQWEANQEKRRQWAQAVESSNARGYVTNEEAAILGVEPGALSQQAREHEQELQEKLDEEARGLQQKLILSEYNKKMAVQEYMEKQLIDKKFGVGDFKQTPSGGSNLSGITVKVKTFDNEGNEIEATVPIEYMDSFNAMIKGENSTRYVDPETGEEVVIPTSSFDDLKTGDEFDKAKVKNYMTIDLANLTSGTKRDDELAHLQEEFWLPYIDNLIQKADTDKPKAKAYAKQAYADIENYANWLDVAYKNDTGDTVDDTKAMLLGEVVDEAFNQIKVINNATETEKNAVKQAFVKLLENSENETLKNRIAPSYSQSKSEVKASTNVNHNTQQGWSANGNYYFYNGKYYPKDEYEEVFTNGKRSIRKKGE